MMIKKRTRQRPQPSWDIYFSDSSMCPLSKNEWSLQKSFSLNNLFSCELAAAAQMDSETGVSSKLCIIYFCISQTQRKRDGKK